MARVGFCMLPRMYICSRVAAACGGALFGLKKLPRQVRAGSLRPRDRAYRFGAQARRDERAHITATLCSQPLLNCLPSIAMHRWLYERGRSHARRKSKSSSSRAGDELSLGVDPQILRAADGGPVFQHNKSSPHGNASALGLSVAP